MLRLSVYTARRLYLHNDVADIIMSSAVTVPDIFADSHLNSTSKEAGAKYAATFTESKYADIASTRLFYPVAIEIAGPCDVRARELIEEINGTMTAVTEELTRRTTFTKEFSSLSREEMSSHYSTPSPTTTKRAIEDCCIVNDNEDIDQSPA